jgi:hypothetical protein
VRANARNWRAFALTLRALDADLHRIAAFASGALGEFRARP